jgi:hypothetical protein
VALSFERVRQRAGDVVGASWSIRSSRRRELTRVNKRPRPQGTADGDRGSRFLRRDQSAILTGLRQSIVFSGTRRRTKRPLKPRFEAPGTRHAVRRCPSNGRVLENETERQTVSSRRWEWTALQKLIQLKAGAVQGRRLDLRLHPRPEGRWPSAQLADAG